MKSFQGALLVLAALAASSAASAQKKGNVITIGEVTIVGRVQKPIASVDVSKIQPKLTLAELRQPFLDRIEEAVGRVGDCEERERNAYVPPPQGWDEIFSREFVERVFRLDA